MDISTLAAAAALPAMVRGVGYTAACLAMSEDGYAVSSGLSSGHCDTIPGQESGDLAVPFDCFTPQAAAAWVEEQVAAIQSRNQQPQE